MIWLYKGRTPKKLQNYLGIFFPNGRPPPPIGNRNKSKWQSDDETSRLVYAISPLCILYYVILYFVILCLVFYVRVCNVAHFVWPHVRSFLSDFTLLLATLPRGKGPNHTLLPSVMQYCIFACSHCQHQSEHLRLKGHSREGECCPQWYRPLFAPRKGKRQTLFKIPSLKI